MASAIDFAKLNDTLKSKNIDPVEVPAALNPDKLSIFRVVSAKGVQVYTCARNPAGGTGWVLRGPDAQLFDSQNKLVGKHYAGPTWEAGDGSKVVGVVKAKVDAPDPRAIPWLLLETHSTGKPASVSSSSHSTVADRGSDWRDAAGHAGRCYCHFGLSRWQVPCLQ